ncbi:MAG: hypothetical protein LBG83_07275 [Oscillospiraceae bacterium]|jgi:hypothetical protein|nr:hypothetical protein [Oscillospiraceae bacterium]
MKKALAVLLGLVLALAVLPACGKTPDPTVTTAAPTTTAEPESLDVVNPEQDGTESSEPEPSETTTIEPDSGAVTTTAPDDSITTTEATEPTTAAGPANKQEAIDLYAAAVNATLKKNPNISKNCDVKIGRPPEGDDGFQKLFKINIAGYKVESVVCGDLLGEGSNVYDQKCSEGLQKSYLTAGDVTGYNAKVLPNGNTELTLTIKNCTNPNKPYANQGNSPIGNFTWDYANVQTTREGIANAEKTVPGLKINVDTVTFDYSNISIKAVIKPDGTFAALTHNFKYHVRADKVEVKLAFVRMGGGEYGGGIGVGVIDYKFL